jgi:hypothetical protein
MSKGASKTWTLGHVHAANYSGLLVEWLLTSSSRFESERCCKNSDTRTCSQRQSQPIAGGMAVDVIKQVRAQKVPQKLGHLDTCTPSITVAC